MSAGGDLARVVARFNTFRANRATELKDLDMSEWIHCDNGSCDKTKEASASEIRGYGKAGWVTVKQDGRTLHFHDGACLAKHLSFHLVGEVSA